MMQIKKLQLLVLFLFGEFVARAQKPLTLEDAILTGLENNFDIRITKEEYNISSLNNKQGTAGRWPSITLGANSINRYDNTPFFDTTVTSYKRTDIYSNKLTPYVNVSWLIFDGMRVNISKQKLDLLESFSAGF
jgi:outer membrane protein TolC